MTAVSEGYYLLSDGETPSSVARRVYSGDVHKAAVLMLANPEDWDDLEYIRVPNKKGRRTALLEGESVQQVIARLFPNQPVSIYIQPFFMWNGGKDARLRAGDLVFIPER